MLDHRVEIYVPTKKGNGDGIPIQLWEQWFEPVKIAFANLFGGYTSYKAIGGFISKEHGKLIEEDIVVLYSYCTERQLREGRAAVLGLARKLRFALVQECVAIVIDGQMEFIGS